MIITIDPQSGYCFGVEYAIEMAEEALQTGDLYCLGDIVHNDMEVSRLAAKGLKIISREDLLGLSNCKVLIRAHGEPPETYKIALENNIELIDASCPVVLKLQHRVKNAFERQKKNDGQIVLFGQQGHAEMIGLAGQTSGQAVLISNEQDLEQIDFSRPVELFSQTTKSTEKLYNIKSVIEQRIVDAQGNSDSFEFNDSICRQVSNREPQLQRFAALHEVILFVSGKKSSNGQALYQVCLKSNPNSYFIESEKDINPQWLTNIDSVGICGATSTPSWLMEQVGKAIGQI